MAVKRSLSASRMLSVFELVARMQPVGVSVLARELGADKSAVQRDIMTLSDAGWIRAVPGLRGQWELTLHALSLARPPHSSHSLRHRLRPLMERLHQTTGETVYLNLPYQNHFVVVDALESQHMLRVVPSIGMSVPMAGSATARAYLAFMPLPVQEALIGPAAAAARQEDLALTRQRGYAINDGDLLPGSVAIAAPVFTGPHQPVGVLVVVGPNERITPERQHEIGLALKEAGRGNMEAWPEIPPQQHAMLAS
jgi:IclR family acetate operon transcriptional repressor